MPRGDKDKYTDKQKRQAEHIEDSYEDRGVPHDEAESRAWATVNKISGGGKKSRSGRGRKTNTAPAKKGGQTGGKKGGAKSAARSSAAKSASAKKSAKTRAAGGGSSKRATRKGGAKKSSTKKSSSRK